jgi:hypothetical protein
MNKEIKDEVACCMDIMLKDINLIEEDKPFESTDSSKINNMLQFIVSSTIEKELTDLYKDFIKNFSFLSFNWNENTHVSEDIKDKCQHLSRFVDDSLFVDEFLSYANIISDRLHQASAYEPPSFKLSEHYLNIIREE